jgi:uncharacterized protein with FMN-binding domain
MRKVMLALLLTAVGLGLLLSFKSRPATSTAALGGSALSGSGENATAPTASASSPANSPAAGSGSSGATSPSSAKSSAKSAGSKSGTFTGASESTDFGPVQVSATVSGGKLTDVTVLQVPDNGGYEQQIVQVALPELKSEALSAQNANIDVVSGATYTSQGYAESLQSALDQAGM